MAEGTTHTVDLNINDKAGKTAGGKPKTTTPKTTAGSKALDKALQTTLDKMEKSYTNKLLPELKKIVNQSGSTKTKTQDSGASRAEINSIIKKIAKELAAEFIKSTAQASSSTKATGGTNKDVEAIAKRLETATSSSINKLAQVLKQKTGVTLDKDTIQQLKTTTTSTAAKSVPKEMITAYKDLSTSANSLKSTVATVGALVKSIKAIRSSGEGIDINELKQFYTALKDLRAEAAKTKEEYKKMRESMKSLKDTQKELLGDFSGALKKIQSGVGAKVRGVEARSKEDPKAFAKEIATALKDVLGKSPTLAPSIDKFDTNVKNMTDVLKQLEAVMKGGKGGVAGDKGFSKELSDLINKLSNIPTVKGGTSGVYNVVPKVDKVVKELESIKIKVEPEIDTTKIEKTVEKSINRAVVAGIKSKYSSMAIEELAKELDKEIQKALQLGKNIEGWKEVGRGKTLPQKLYTEGPGYASNMIKGVPTKQGTPVRKAVETVVEILDIAHINGFNVELNKMFTKMGKELGRTNEAAASLYNSIEDVTTNIEDLEKRATQITKKIKASPTPSAAGGGSGEEPPRRGGPPGGDEPPRRGGPPSGGGKPPDDGKKAASSFAITKRRLEGTMRAPEIGLVKEYTSKIIQPSKLGQQVKSTGGTTFGKKIQEATAERVDSLSKSLDDLQEYMIRTVESELESTSAKRGKPGWAVVKKKYANIDEAVKKKSEFFTTGKTPLSNAKLDRQWKMQIADVGEMMTKINVSQDASVKTIVEGYQTWLSELESQMHSPEERSKLVGKWIKISDKPSIKKWEKTGLKPAQLEKLAALKDDPDFAGPAVGEGFVKEIEKIVGGGGEVRSKKIEQLFKATMGTIEASRKMREGWVERPGGGKPDIGHGAVVRTMAIPAAKLTPTGGTVFETTTGSKRGLAQFATFKSGFERIYDALKKQEGFNRARSDYELKLKEVGGVLTSDSPKKEQAKQLAEEMFKSLKGKPAEAVRKQYAEAGTMVGVKRAKAGIGTVSGFEGKVIKLSNALEKMPMDRFIKEMDALGVSALDVMRSLDKIDFQNVYDIYQKVYEGEKDRKPLLKMTQYPQGDKSIREFEKATRQVEQMMPLVDASRPRRGMHQENVVNFIAETSEAFQRKSPRSPEDQKKLIRDVNIRMNEMFDELNYLDSGLKSRKPPVSKTGRRGQLPTGIRTISSLGLPESQAASVMDFRSRSGKRVEEYEQGTEYLGPLKGTGLKMYTDDLKQLAPFGAQFTQFGRQIASVTNAMASSTDKVSDIQKKFKGKEIGGIGTEFPGLRTERERDIISGGRYGTKGYGFNVMTELRHTAGTFEDQVQVSGRLAQALTTITKTVMLPSEGGRIRNLQAEGEGAAMSPVALGYLKDLDRQDIGKWDVEKKATEVSKMYQDVLGIPKQYQGRADKALIEDVKKTISIVRSEDVEVQAAKLTEVFLNSFGRKFTTRYGSKGVGVSLARRQEADTSEQMAERLKDYPGGVKILPEEQRQYTGLGTKIQPKSAGEMMAELLEPADTTPEAKKLTDNLKSKLVDSGNKFIIDMFKSTKEGVAVPEEAKEQQKLFEEVSSMMKDVSGVPLSVNTEEARKQIQDFYKEDMGREEFFKEVPIDIRISSKNIGKRGLQAELLESAMSNIIGGGAGTQTTMKTELEQRVYEELLGKTGEVGKLSKLSGAVGYKGTESSREDIEKALMAGGTKELLAKRAAALEAASQYYSDVIDEFGKRRKGLVGEKFVSIVEEPHGAKEWSKREVEKQDKGVKLKIPEYSAYSTIFGTDSPIMKEIRERSNLKSKEAFEYIKALQFDPFGGDEDIKKNMMRGLETVPLGDISSFTKHTGTFQPGDKERSMLSTMYDVEKFPAPFVTKLPSRKGMREEPEDFYVPGPLARGVYPEPLIAGEYGPSPIGRRLQHIINMAKEVEKFANEAEQFTSEVDVKTAEYKAEYEKEGGADPTALSKVAKELQKAKVDLERFEKGVDQVKLYHLTDEVPKLLAKKIKDVLATADPAAQEELLGRMMASMQVATPTGAVAQVPKGYGFIDKMGMKSRGTAQQQTKAMLEQKGMKEALSFAADLVIGPKNLQENFDKAKKGLEASLKKDTGQELSPADTALLKSIETDPTFDTGTAKDPGLSAQLQEYTRIVGRKMTDKGRVRKPRGYTAELYGAPAEKQFEFIETLGLEKDLALSPEDRYKKEMIKLDRAKVDYYEDLAKQALGKKGAVATSTFQRRVPSIMAKAVTAVVDKRRDLEAFEGTVGNIYKKYEDKLPEVVGFDDLATAAKGIGEIREQHTDVIKKYKRMGMPVLMERELGVSATMAGKIPAEFQKKFKIDKRGAGGLISPHDIKPMDEPVDVKGTLKDLLMYKSQVESMRRTTGRSPATKDISDEIGRHIEKDLIPYIESVRFPFTGVSSVQPYKAKLMTGQKGPAGKYLGEDVLSVPGVPEGLEGLDEQLEALRGIVTAAETKRHELITIGEASGETDFESIKNLTGLINDLNKAITAVIPKYYAVQQKLDFDGDAIQIHSAIAVEARNDIKKHFDMLGKDFENLSLASQWAADFSAGGVEKSTGKYPIAEMQTAFEKKFPKEKGYEFLKKPFLSRELEYLKPEEQLGILGGRAGGATGVWSALQEAIEETVEGGIPGGAQTKADYLVDAINKIKEPDIEEDQSDEEKAALRTGYAKEMLEVLKTEEKELKGNLTVLVQEEIKSRLYNAKHLDAVEAQLYKIHTGKDVEALNRLVAVFESRSGFGAGGMLAAKGGVGPEKFDRLTQLNEMYRWASQKGMDVKHAGQAPKAGEMVRLLSTKGGPEELWNRIQSQSEYEGLKEFAESNKKVIESRMGGKSFGELEKIYADLPGADAVPPKERDELIAAIVEQAGFKGFLEELHTAIKEEALKGIIESIKATHKGMPDAAVIAKAQKDLASDLKSMHGVNISTHFTKEQQPLYKFRTKMASTQQQANIYKDKYGKMQMPEFEYAGTWGAQTGREFESKYRRAKATAVNVGEAFQGASATEGRGAYGELVHSSIENIYRDQKAINDILKALLSLPENTGTLAKINELQKSLDYDFGSMTTKIDTEFTKNFTGAVGTYKRGAKQMATQVESLSMVAGVPRLSDEERSRIKKESKERWTARAQEKFYPKTPDKEYTQEEEEEWQGKINEFLDMMVERDQAIQQMQKVFEVMGRRRAGGRTLIDILPSAKESKDMFDPKERTAMIDEINKYADTFTSGKKPTPTKTAQDYIQKVQGGGPEIPTGGGGAGFGPQGGTYKVFIMGAAADFYKKMSGGVYMPTGPDEMSGNEDPFNITEADIKVRKAYEEAARKEQEGRAASDFSIPSDDRVRRADKTLSTDKFINAKPILHGEGTNAVFENLKRLQQSAIDYQTDLGENLENLLRGKEELAKYGEVLDAIHSARESGKEEGGTTPTEFFDLTDDLRKRKDLPGNVIQKAWKQYRIALTDYYLKQAGIAKTTMEELDAVGTDDEAASDQYRKYRQYVKAAQEEIKGLAGKRSSPYTYNRRWVDTDAAVGAGVYMTPEQQIRNAEGPLGEDKELIKTFKGMVSDVNESIISGGETKLTPPITKARDALKSLTDIDEKWVDILNDVEKVKLVGSDIAEIWDLEKLIGKVTLLRQALEDFSRFSMDDDKSLVNERKNIEETVRFLKQLEKSYSALDLSKPKKGDEGVWGETGVTPVPKFASPKLQEALHAANIKKITEYFKRAEAEGGPRKGERQSYTAKVVGQSGDVIKHQVHNFHKYGEAANYAGARVGQFSTSIRDLSKEMQGGNRTFTSALRRVVMWGGAATLVYGGVSKLRDSIGLISEVETRMAELRMVMNPLSTQFDKMQASAFGMAKQYGVPVTDVLGSMRVFAQQGLKQGEVIDRTQTATLAANVTTLNAKDATEALTAAMKVFRGEGESSLRFLDSWSEVESKHAITAGDLANAIKKSAAAAKNAGVTFDELNGIVAAIGSTTRQSGKEIGTSLRFIFRRLTSEKGPKELSKLGIPVMDNEDLRGGYDILGDLQGKWNDLTGAQKMNIAQAIGGTRQYNSLLVLMDNWAEATSAAADSVNSKGSAERRNLELMKTYSKQLEQTTQAANELKVEFGKAYLPIAKISLKGMKGILEFLSQIPSAVKLAAVGFSVFFAAIVKGAGIIDSLVARLRGASSGFNDFKEAAMKGLQLGTFEVTGKKIGESEYFKDLDTIGSGGKESIDKFSTFLGKSAFLLHQKGLKFNKVVSEVTEITGQAAGKPFTFVGTGLAKVGEGLSFGADIAEGIAAAKGGKTLAASRVGGKGIKEGLAGMAKSHGMTDATMKGLGKGMLGKGGFKASAKVFGKAFLSMSSLLAMEVGGLTSKAVGETIKGVGSGLGSAGENAAKYFGEQNAGLVKAILPMTLTATAGVMAIDKLSDSWKKLMMSSQDYKKVIDARKKVNEADINTVGSLISRYDSLNTAIRKVDKAARPGDKEKAQEQERYQSPLLMMGRVQKDVTMFTNNLAAANLDLTAGYDELGNAILKSGGNLKYYMEQLKKAKIVKGVETDLGMAEKYVYDLTQVEGAEKWKSTIRDVVKTTPVIGDLLAKGVKVSPAKMIEETTKKLNDLLAQRSKYGLSTSFDKDIQEQQKSLKKIRGTYSETLTSFKKFVSDIRATSEEGFSADEIAKIFTDERIIDGFKVIAESLKDEYRSLKDVIKWEDVLGAEVMGRLDKNIRPFIGAVPELTTARMEEAQIKAKKSGDKYNVKDVLIFNEEFVKKYHGTQGQLIREMVDGSYAYFVRYFNTKTLKIEKKAVDENSLNNIIDSVFPISKLQEDFEDKLGIFNEFVAGAAAGLRGIGAKAFKKDFNLGERFFSEIPTSTIMQGSKGFVPTGVGGTFGESPFQQGWGKDFKEFYEKPMTEYKRTLEMYEKQRAPGLEAENVTFIKQYSDELEELQKVLQNNQVVFQLRAVFADLTKTMEGTVRSTQESIAVEKKRQEIDKNASGFLKGLTTGLENINVGPTSLGDLTPRQRSLRENPEFAQAAGGLTTNRMQLKGIQEQRYAIQRAMVASDSINKLSSELGTQFSPEDLKRYTESVAAGDDKGISSMTVAIGKVEDNTGAIKESNLSIVERLDKMLENQGDPEAIDKLQSSWKDMIKTGSLGDVSLKNFPGGLGGMKAGMTINALERVSRLREKYTEAGDTESVIKTNKALDELSKNLVRQEGLKGAISAVDRKKTLFDKRFSSEELINRAFSGIDSKQLLDRMVPTYDAKGKDLYENKDVKNLVDLQKQSNKALFPDSAKLAKYAAMTAVWQEFSKKQSSNIIRKLETANVEAETELKGLRTKAGDTPDDKMAAEISKKEKEIAARGTAIAQQQKNLQRYRLAQHLEILGAGSVAFGKSVGLSEKQVKKLGAGAVAAYGGLKLISDQMDIPISERAKDFGEAMKDMAAETTKSGKPGIVTAAKYEYAKKRFMSDYEKEKAKAMEGSEEIKPIGKVSKETQKQAEKFVKELKESGDVKTEALTKMLITLLTGMATEFVMTRNEQETQLAGLTNEAKEQSKVMRDVLISDKNAMKAAQNVFTELQKAQEPVKKSEVEMLEKQRGISAQDEYASQIDKLVELDSKLANSTQELTENIAEQADKIRAIDFSRKLQTSLEEMVQASMSRSREAALERKYGQTQILNKGLGGFPGQVSLPTLDKDKSAQERLFISASKGMDDFKKSLLGYKEFERELPHQRKNIQMLEEQRAAAIKEAGATGGMTPGKRILTWLAGAVPDVRPPTILGNEFESPKQVYLGWINEAVKRWKALEKQITSSEDALSELSKEMRVFGEATSNLLRFTSAMDKLNDSIEDTSTIEAADKMMRNYTDIMDKLLGGSHPDALTEVTVAQQREALKGGVDLDPFNTTKMQLEEGLLRGQIAGGGLTAQALADAIQKLHDLPEEYERKRLYRRQHEYDAALKAAQAPFKQTIYDLQKIKTYTPKMAGKADALQQKMLTAMERAPKVYDKDVLLKELETDKKGVTQSKLLQNFYSKFGIDKELISEESMKTLKADIEAVKAGEPSQYRGIVGREERAYIKEAQQMKEDYLKEVPTLDMSEMKVAVTNPLLSELTRQTSLLGEIAKAYGLDEDALKDMGVKAPEFFKEDVPKEMWIPKWIYDPTKENKASGGRVFGEGGPKEDKVPAMLSPGEYVIKASSAKKLGYATLSQINSQGTVPGFAEGGELKDKPLTIGERNAILEKEWRERMRRENAPLLVKRKDLKEAREKLKELAKGTAEKEVDKTKKQEPVVVPEKKKGFNMFINPSLKQLRAFKKTEKDEEIVSILKRLRGYADGGLPGVEEGSDGFFRYKFDGVTYRTKTRKFAEKKLKEKMAAAKVETIEEKNDRLYKEWYDAELAKKKAEKEKKAEEDKKTEERVRAQIKADKEAEKSSSNVIPTTDLKLAKAKTESVKSRKKTLAEKLAERKKQYEEATGIEDEAKIGTGEVFAEGGLVLRLQEGGPDKDDWKWLEEQSKKSTESMKSKTPSQLAHYRKEARERRRVEAVNRLKEIKNAPLINETTKKVIAETDGIKSIDKIGGYGAADHQKHLEAQALQGRGERVPEPKFDEYYKKSTKPIKSKTTEPVWGGGFVHGHGSFSEADWNKYVNDPKQKKEAADRKAKQKKYYAERKLNIQKLRYQNKQGSINEYFKKFGEDEKQEQMGPFQHFTNVATRKSKPEEVAPVGKTKEVYEYKSQRVSETFWDDIKKKNAELDKKQKKQRGPSDALEKYDRYYTKKLEKGIKLSSDEVKVMNDRRAAEAAYEGPYLKKRLSQKVYKDGKPVITKPSDTTEEALKAFKKNQERIFGTDTTGRAKGYVPKTFNAAADSGAKETMKRIKNLQEQQKEGVLIMEKAKGATGSWPSPVLEEASEPPVLQKMFKSIGSFISPNKVHAAELPKNFEKEKWWIDAEKEFRKSEQVIRTGGPLEDGKIPKTTVSEIQKEVEKASDYFKRYREHNKERVLETERGKARIAPGASFNEVRKVVAKLNDHHALMLKVKNSVSDDMWEYMADTNDALFASRSKIINELKPLVTDVNIRKDYFSTLGIAKDKDGLPIISTVGRAMKGKIESAAEEMRNFKVGETSDIYVRKGDIASRRRTALPPTYDKHGNIIYNEKEQIKHQTITTARGKKDVADMYDVLKANEQYTVGQDPYHNLRKKAQQARRDPGLGGYTKGSETSIGRMFIEEQEGRRDLGLGSDAEKAAEVFAKLHHVRERKKQEILKQMSTEKEYRPSATIMLAGKASDPKYRPITFNKDTGMYITAKDDVMVEVEKRLNKAKGFADKKLTATTPGLLRERAAQRNPELYKEWATLLHKVEEAGGDTKSDKELAKKWEALTTAPGINTLYKELSQIVVDIQEGKGIVGTEKLRYANAAMKSPELAIEWKKVFDEKMQKHYGVKNWGKYANTPLMRKIEEERKAVQIAKKYYGGDLTDEQINELAKNKWDTSYLLPLKDRFIKGWGDNINKFKSFFSDENTDELGAEYSTPVYHQGGFVRKTGKIFAEKGELVVPKGFAEGGVVGSEESKVASQALKGAFKVTVDTTDLENLIKEGIKITNMDEKVSVDVGDATVPVTIENVPDSINVELTNVPESVEMTLTNLPDSIPVTGIPEGGIDVNMPDVGASVGEAITNALASATITVEGSGGGGGTVGSQELDSVAKAVSDVSELLTGTIEDVNEKFTLIESNAVSTNSLNEKINEVVASIETDIYSGVNTDLAGLRTEQRSIEQRLNVVIGEVALKANQALNFIGGLNSNA